MRAADQARRTTEAALVLVPLLGLWLVSGCEEAPPTGNEWPRIEIIDTMDPDLSDRLDPVDGFIVWVSTYAGTARVITSGRQIIGPSPVSGGELTITAVSPSDLEIGANTVEIRLHPSSGGQELVAQTVLVVEARCTNDSHCGTGQRCEAFECVAY